MPSQKLEALPYVDDPGLRGVHGEVQLTLEDLHKQTLGRLRPVFAFA